MGTVKLKWGEKCGICGNRYLRNVAVDAVAVRDGKVLLIKRGNEPDRGKWALPGGLLDWNEQVGEATLREFTEETGFLGKLGRFVGIYSDPKRDLFQRVAAVYEVVITGGMLRFGDDALDAKWFRLNGLPKLAADHNGIIKDYRNLKLKMKHSKRNT